MNFNLKPASWLALFGVIVLSGSLLLSACVDGSSGPPIGADLPSCISPDQNAVEGHVVHIADGDTITVRIDGQDFRLRYIGINAPEMDSEAQKALAEQASELNRRLVEGQSVVLYRDTSETDRFERLLRYVFVDDTFVNFELVRRGLARAHDYPPDTACSDALEDAEQQARQDGLGIWAGQ